MKVIDPGHEYMLRAIDGGEAQRLVFVKREGPNYPGNTGAHAGLLTQEVLRACLDRCRYMNGQFSCAETEMVIGLLETAIMLFEVRAARCRGTVINLAHSDEVETEEICAICGHIQCDQGRHSQPHWSENHPLQSGDEVKG